ncbi:transketolase [Wenzhouxiangella sp. XN79A]|uniref:transketolase n=1 Tax=Wenzhouxiangella sp. XN79A TaxID=2724193 RepID=UPI00144AA60E|nr:transketolase [Wenzhouxiangella sp. XN79A]NKI35015.1 transketolase [Wenzhouxiangella sp. XN79A]
MTAARPSRRTLANAIRALAMDAVQRAESGHPGMPMGMADIAEALYNDTLRHNPANPGWWDRDRFVVSNGHGSMLLYSVLHLSGYGLSLEDLKNFRQLHSPTPGHPEYGEAPGVETTTGPLGQGLANAVGMALAEKLLAARFNRDDFDLVDHFTWVFAGDGCLMEGISHEVCSLAGTWQLGKLVVFYDDNGISIDGETRGWFTDNTPERFRAYGWQVIEAVDGHDAEAVRAAIDEARADLDRPTLICCRTTIGFGAPNKQGTADTHGAPLGDEEIAATREALGWNHAPFEIPDEVRAAWDARERGAALEAEWNALLDRYREAHPDAAAEFERRMRGELPEDFDARAAEIVARMQADDGKVATRKASGMSLEAFGPLLPELLGGSADLTGSNNTNWSGSVDIMERPAEGNYIYYGVREFGMTAIANGLHLHGGFIPYTGTFLVFSDYARNAVRMSALVPTGAVHVYTHDSIGLGEDGPTHQPVEHVASLRMIPNLEVWRPCDKAETAVAWREALKRRHAPTALVLTRQGLEHQPRSDEQLEAIARGGYVLRDGGEAPQAAILATGSEVALAVAAAGMLAGEGIAVRVVSMPNPERFAEQPADWRERVLPGSLRARVAVEAGVSAYWRGLVGDRGRVVGIDTFGASAPAGELFRHFDLTAERVAREIRAVIGAD